MRDLEQQVHTLIGSSSELRELWTTECREATQQAKQLRKRYQSQDEQKPKDSDMNKDQTQTLKKRSKPLYFSSNHHRQKTNHPLQGGQELQTKRTRQRQKILNKEQKATRKKRRTYRKNRHKCIDAYSESFMLFKESLNHKTSQM